MQEILTIVCAFCCEKDWGVIGIDHSLHFVLCFSSSLSTPSFRCSTLPSTSGTWTAYEMWVWVVDPYFRDHFGERCDWLNENYAWRWKTFTQPRHWSKGQDVAGSSLDSGSGTPPPPPPLTAPPPIFPVPPSPFSLSALCDQACRADEKLGLVSNRCIGVWGAMVVEKWLLQLRLFLVVCVCGFYVVVFVLFIWFFAGKEGIPLWGQWKCTKGKNIRISLLLAIFRHPTHKLCKEKWCKFSLEKSKMALIS